MPISREQLTHPQDDREEQENNRYIKKKLQEIQQSWGNTEEQRERERHKRAEGMYTKPVTVAEVPIFALIQGSPRGGISLG
jgi:hypothetical protein